MVKIGGDLAKNEELKISFSNKKEINISEPKPIIQTKINKPKVIQKEPEKSDITDTNYHPGINELYIAYQMLFGKTKRGSNDYILSLIQQNIANVKPNKSKLTK